MTHERVLTGQDSDARHGEARTERWEDPTAFAPAPSLKSSAEARPRLPRDEVRTGDDSLDNDLVENTPTESAATTAGSTQQLQQKQKQKQLPWETKAGYVMGPGELGLLNELQLPRRGAIVPLPPDFLRIPPPLRALEGRGASSEGLQLKFSPIETRRVTRPRGENGLDMTFFDVQQSKSSDKNVDEDGGHHPPDEGDGGSGGGGGGDSVDPAKRTRVDPSLAPLALPPADMAPLRDPLMEEEIASVDEVRRKPLLETDGVEEVHAEDKRPRKVLDAAETLGRSSDRNSWPEQNGDGPLYSSFGSMRGIVGAVRKVDMATSADRIAALPPGTRFRVAVDKGVTGLGITVKEIQGRFFVYRLQTSPDGSPGAAQVRSRCSLFAIWRAPWVGVSALVRFPCRGWSA